MAIKNNRVLKEMRKDFNQQLVVILSAAVVYICGSFWNTALTDTIKSFVPVGSSWLWEIGIAALLTVVGAAVVYLVSKNLK